MDPEVGDMGSERTRLASPGRATVMLPVVSAVVDRPEVGPTLSPLLERERIFDERVTGIVIAGGRSLRMGTDKALVELAGKPLAAWVLDALRSVTDDQLIVTRRKTGHGLSPFNVPVVVDRLEARGPLTGLHAGLKAAESDLCLVVACDMPLVRESLLVLLARSIGVFHAAIPYIGEGSPPKPGEFSTAHEAGIQPLLAAYRRRCIEPIEKLLRQGPVPTGALPAVIKARIVQPAEWRAVDPDARSFFNVNSPGDIAEAQRLLNVSM